MDVDYRAIGARVRKYRLLHNMTQEQLSELANLTPAHLSHIETANTKVSLPSLLQIANVLDVTLDDLVCGSLTHTKHVAIKEMDHLLMDCSDAEMQALVTIVEASKRALRTVNPHKFAF